MPKEQHHYVPRFILKNFTKGERQKIFVYDKSNDNVFQTNINNIAAEKGFYNIDVEDNVLTMEPGLAHIEANTAGIIKKIIKERTLKTLDEHEVAILALFLAVQFVRTKEHRLKFEHIGELLAQKLRKWGATGDNIEEITKSSTGIPEDKIVGFKSVIGAKEFVPHFLNKTWVLFETTHKIPFFISDNPITLHNELDHGPYGNLGLAVRGIEIYLPISTTLSLCLLCPSIAEEFQKAYENIKMLERANPERDDEIMNKLKETKTFCDGLIKGTPTKVTEENVIMLNSLQVIYSSRFVYCETDTFGLVKRMINDNKKYREGLKPIVN